MKQILHSILLLLSLSLVQLVNAQTNSIELKDGNGSLISQHNSIASAYAAIPAGITQSYFIEITSTYDCSMETFPITFGANTGSGPNLITLRPAFGVPAISIFANNSAGAIIQMTDADYMVIDGRAGGIGNTIALTIDNSGSGSNTNTIVLTDGATHNVIRYCRIENGTVTNAGRGIFFGPSTVNPTGNSDNLVEYCELFSGRYKIATNGTVANPNTRIQIIGCEFKDIVFVGFWYQSGTGKVFMDSCSFHSVAPTGSGPYAILFDGLADTVTFTRNHIYELSNGVNTTAVRGISIRSVSTTTANYSRFINNFVDLSSTNSSSVQEIGMEFLGANKTTSQVLFNTVRVGGTFTGTGASGNILSACFYNSSSNDSNSFDVRNNIFVNTRTGGNVAADHVSIAHIDSGNVFPFDYNTYNTSAGKIARIGTTVFTTMASYKTALGGLEAHSNDTAVEFTGFFDLHLDGISLGNLGLAGLPISGITNDIDNDTRGILPYRGADEAFPQLGPNWVSSFPYDENFSVYPNPVTDRFNISIPENFGKEFTIQILDILGHECFSSVINSQGKTKIEYSAKEIHLKGGIYLVRIYSEKMMMNRRIVVED